MTAAVVALEDDPLFNAGRGAVFTAAGTQEMDAAVMDGRERRAGAVAGIFGPNNPVLAARAVMEHSPHVLLIGEGALAFCREQGLTFAEPDYFHTEARWQALQQTLAQRGAADAPRTTRRAATARSAPSPATGRGNLAAATSTGGMTGKLPGRVGDSPIIGAGTYADNATCAVSATGHGEFFIRYAAAHEIAARLRHARPVARPRRRARSIDELGRIGGSGGLVAVDRDGDVALPFNCSGMYRGYVNGRRNRPHRDLRRALPIVVTASGLRLRRRCFGAAAALGHELVEFGLVLGVAQAVEELLELALLLFEAAQGFGAVFVEGAVAARGLAARPHQPGRTIAPRVRCLLHPLHACCQRLAAASVPRRCVQHAIRPLPIRYPRSDEAERPPHQKAHDQSARSRPACRDRPSVPRASWPSSSCECI